VTALVVAGLAGLVVGGVLSATAGRLAAGLCLQAAGTLALGLAGTWVLYAGGHLDDAINIVKQAIARKPDCEGGYYLLGRALFSTGRYQELADHFVDVGGHYKNDEEVIAFLRSRTAPIPFASQVPAVAA